MLLFPSKLFLPCDSSLFALKPEKELCAPGLQERELEKLKEEAAALGKASFAFAFFMDRQKEERERGELLRGQMKTNKGRIVQLNFVPRRNT